MKETMHQKDKQVAAMNDNFKAKMSEQESRFDAEIQLIRHENKVREGTISQKHEQREHDLTEQIKIRDRKWKKFRKGWEKGEGLSVGKGGRVCVGNGGRLKVGQIRKG
jgi:hypothetical protein